MKVNNEMLAFYFWLGSQISIWKQDSFGGISFYKTLSKDLVDMFPDVKSFSTTNLKYMQYFYEMYTSPQAEDSVNTSSPQLVDLRDSGIFSIPWGHNRVIIDKCRGDINKAMFYVAKTLENNWSRAVLLNFLDTDLYERQGKAITNFQQTLPATESDLAQAITKDPYSFDFLTIREKYDEKELKGENDAPTLGLIICKSKDNVKAQYALEASSQPMGISEYDITKFIPEGYRSSLPTIKEIEENLGNQKA